MKQNSKIKRFILFSFKYKRWIFSFSLLLIVLFYFSLPKPLFKAPTSIVLEDKDGNLLGASIAKDGQWRFPYSENIPSNFEKAIIEFEDRRFNSHIGIDPKGIARAIEQNIRNKKVVSGGSTLSMQVIRMARGKKNRNVLNKIIEAFLAIRLECSYSKKEILATYASHAPFGGNVVGLDAASWRYYGKRPDLLSWGEAATLAVLPNSPALIHPGRNRKALLNKRNRLLDRLYEKNEIDTMTCVLAKEEPLPKKPIPLPRHAPHLLDRAALEHFYQKKNKLTRLKTTIDPFVQKQTNQILKKHQDRLAANGIHNACVLILEVETGNVISYVGNMPNIKKEHSPSVDIIKAPRSTGSILKPFLFAAMIDDASILPESIISDIPTQMGNYRPLNYYKTYDGAVPANRALIRSLNVPFIRMLQKYGVAKFHHKLKKLGMTTLNKPPNHYGLTLIVGGAEGNLWDITGMYASLARVNNNFYHQNGWYNHLDIHQPKYVKTQNKKEKKLKEEANVLKASSIWHTFNSIQNVERPTSEGLWENFESDKKIAWKTGTSFGFRDAWAVGVTPKYAVGVWTGNADGEGRPGLIGVYASAPILFDIFNLLQQSNWFDQPEDEMETIEICKESGFKAMPICPNKKKIRLPLISRTSKACPFHKIIHINKEGKQVNSSCENINNIENKSWFVLPPLEEHYFKTKNPTYKKLPSFKENCFDNQNSKQSPIQMIYPKFAAKIYIPIGYDGEKNKSIFKATHRDQNTILYWHLNNKYLGQTETFHEIEIDPYPGKHLLTLIDQKGNQIEQKFEILEK